MEKVPHRQAPKKENSREVLALVLIGLGIVWLLKQTGVFYGFPFFDPGHVFEPIQKVFHGIKHLFFSWPVILIVIGLVLMAGKRSGGVVLLIIGGVFLLPKLFFLTGATFLFLFPLILIAIGIALVSRLL